MLENLEKKYFEKKYFEEIYLDAAILYYKEQIESFKKYKTEDFENIKDKKEKIIKIQKILEEEFFNNSLNFPDWIVEIYNLNLEVFKF